jgi:drug/metabolite transporter (DMT)-like permease
MSTSEHPNQSVEEKSVARAIGMALLAAALYGISAPASKLLLVKVPPVMMAALLYLGAGLGMLMVNQWRVWRKHEQREAKMTKKEMPFVIGMIVLDIAAPIMLMMGLTLTNSASVSLLNNFEIVATALIAMTLFRESVGRRMWIAIILITFSSILLSVEDFSNLSFSVGSLFVVGACICWGIENNCTRMLSIKDPLQVVVIKGFGSGMGSLLIAFSMKIYQISVLYLLVTLLLGFVAYGLSIYFYISAQRVLGAARTSAYYAAAPFIGVLLSWGILHERLTSPFFAALLVMLLGTYFAVTEKHRHEHLHEEITHEHKHHHEDGHHNHLHDTVISGSHSHVHTHETISHVHRHTPDVHHGHSHK